MKKIYKSVAMVMFWVLMLETTLCNTVFAADSLKVDIRNIIEAVEDMVLSSTAVEELSVDESVSSSVCDINLSNISGKYSKLNGIEKTYLLKEYGVRSDTMEICESRGYSVSKAIPVAQLMQRLDLDIDKALEMVDYYGSVVQALEEASRLVDESRNKAFLLDSDTYKEFSLLITKGYNLDALMNSYVFASLSGMDLTEVVPAITNYSTQTVQENYFGLDNEISAVEMIENEVDFSTDENEAEFEAIAEETTVEEITEAIAEEITVEEITEAVVEETTVEEYTESVFEEELDFIQENQIEETTQNLSNDINVDSNEEMTAETTEEVLENADISNIPQNSELMELAEVYCVDYEIMYNYLYRYDLMLEELEALLYEQAVNLGLIEPVQAYSADDEESETDEQPEAPRSYEKGTGYNIAYSNGTPTIVDNLINLKGAKNLDLNINYYWESTARIKNGFGAFRLGMPMLVSDSMNGYQYKGVNTLSYPNYVYLDTSASCYGFAKGNRLKDLTGQILRAEDDITYEAANNNEAVVSYNGYECVAKYKLNYQNGNTDFYDAFGRIIKRQNIYGQYIEFLYDKNMRENLYINDSVGNKIHIVYNEGLHSISSVTIYDSSSNKIKEINYTYSSTIDTFDSTSVIKTENVLENSNVTLQTNYTFDSCALNEYPNFKQRRLKSITTPTGLQTTFTYSASPVAQVKGNKMPQYFVEQVQQSGNDAPVYTEKYSYIFSDPTSDRNRRASTCIVSVVDSAGKNIKSTKYCLNSENFVYNKTEYFDNVTLPVTTNYNYEFVEKKNRGVRGKYYFNSPMETWEYVDFSTSNSRYRNIQYWQRNKFGKITNYSQSNGGNAVEYTYNNDYGLVTSELRYDTPITAYHTKYTYDSTGLNVNSAITYYGNVTYGDKESGRVLTDYSNC